MGKKSRTLFIWMTIFAILGTLFAGMGFHKILVYENSESAWGSHINAYVGGDAYNYIINGTYFSGYCVLSGSMFICACLCGIQSQKAESFNELLEVTRETNCVVKQRIEQEPTSLDNYGKEFNSEGEIQK